MGEKVRGVYSLGARPAKLTFVVYNCWTLISIYNLDK